MRAALGLQKKGTTITRAMLGLERKGASIMGATPSFAGEGVTSVGSMPVSPSTTRGDRASTLIGSAPWFQTAVFYEVPVRSFQDSNGDGTGDLPGLISRLDYLQWLGVDCIWLLPINASPLRDGGYDISDYYGVLPAFGSLDDVRRLLEEAHRRDVRVVMDLVMNHTSSDHPWFQSARSSSNSPHRDWYVWSDTDRRYADARVIFCDSLTSNWSWDAQGGAFYWHRFFPHQPDLNYDNPEVREAMFDVVRFWLDLGLDGFRLDAVPYLYEREATNCENLPETHAFLADLRRMVDREYSDDRGPRLLLAEANQWPRDAVGYFGSPERPECHMNFHFPLMPRLFMALRREDSTPITDILKDTPPLPEQCQWGIFLRNHDELTLEMVTEQDRAYMWSEYAHDPRMRLNLGIRRRLAPLLDNSRPKLHLILSLLLSLPGSPFLYYGDEIGMGDNVALEDRDGVRTPMQWASDVNGGFSSSTPGGLYSPPIVSPTYGHETLNVESEAADSSSLLNWVRRCLALRREWPAFGTGAFEMIPATNRSIFAFIRRSSDTVVLCVHNLSGVSQEMELNLAAFVGGTPVDLIQEKRLSPIDDGLFSHTMPPHGFLWLRLDP